MKHPRPVIDPRLEQAYAHFRAGRVEAARRNYGEVFLNDPNNIDARLGLAAIFLARGKVAEAREHYREILETDPGNAHALAALLNQAAMAEPVASESRLKMLLAAQPDSAPLNFCLGNIYSRQQRWAEARQRYHNAAAVEGDNPDYLFNLAVSLDHLRESSAASRYYRLALDAGERNPPAFDLPLARQRILDLDARPGEASP